MDIQPGQLILAKTDFEASVIPLDWQSEQTQSKGNRKTLRYIKVKKNDILLIVEVPTRDVVHTPYGFITPITHWTLTFLKGSSLCFMVSVIGLDDYIEPIVIPNV